MDCIIFNNKLYTGDEIKRLFLEDEYLIFENRFSEVFSKKIKKQDIKKCKDMLDKFWNDGKYYNFDDLIIKGDLDND